MQRQHAGIFHFDLPRQRGCIGLHALDGADQPVEHVDIVAGLVHEGAAVEFPGAAPRGAVIVGLRPAPEDVDRHQVDLAEAVGLDGALEQLQGRVLAVLLDDEEMHAGIVARLHHRLAVFQTGGHGLLAHHMATRLCHPDSLGGVESARRRQHDQVGIGALEQRLEGGETGRAGPLNGALQRHGIDVGDRDELGPGGVTLEGLEVIGRDATAADQGEADLAIAGDRLAHEHIGGFSHEAPFAPLSCRARQSSIRTVSTTPSGVSSRVSTSPAR